MNAMNSFFELVKKHFGFLVTEYKFKIQNSLDYTDGFPTVNIVSNTLLVRVGKDLERIVVLLRPSGKPKISQLSLIRVLEASSVISEKDFPGDVNPEIHDQVLDKYARRLKEHCETLLRGDLTHWNTILTIVLKRIKDNYISRTGTDISICGFNS